MNKKRNKDEQKRNKDGQPDRSQHRGLLRYCFYCNKKGNPPPKEIKGANWKRHVKDIHSSIEPPNASLKK